MINSQSPPGDSFASADAEAQAPTDSTPFVHLHVHSNFSFLDGGSRIEELVARAAELGQPALALTDHDGLYGAVRFAKACAKHGIKPIFGAEVRVESLLPGGGGAVPATAEPRRPAQTPRNAAAAAGAPRRPGRPAPPGATRRDPRGLCQPMPPALRRPPGRSRAGAAPHRHRRVTRRSRRGPHLPHRLQARRDRLPRRRRPRRGGPRRPPPPLRRSSHRDHLYVELQYFGYEPHQEAHAGQHGSPVYEKIRADGNRLRHRPTTQPAAALRPAPPGPQRCPAPFPTVTALLHSHRPPFCPVAYLLLLQLWLHLGARLWPRRPHRRALRRLVAAPQRRPSRPAPRRPTDGSIPPTSTSASTATADPGASPASPTASAWPAWPDACGVGTVLTTNAHYAGENDRALHLVCRAAGRDKPLSGYPEPVPGVRYLQSKAELETLAEPAAGADRRRGRAPGLVGRLGTSRLRSDA